VSEEFGCFAAGDFKRATVLFRDDLVRSCGDQHDTGYAIFERQKIACPVTRPSDLDPGPGEERDGW
jgi:hypothetical protein